MNGYRDLVARPGWRQGSLFRGFSEPQWVMYHVEAGKRKRETRKRMEGKGREEKREREQEVWLGISVHSASLDHTVARCREGTCTARVSR